MYMYIDVNYTIHVHYCDGPHLQALWRTLHNPDDSVAGVAYRVLGKFGGSNRKMISTPQPVSLSPQLRIYHTVCALYIAH